MQIFNFYFGTDGFNFFGQNGWTQVGPGSWTPQPIAAAPANEDKHNKTSSVDNKAPKNKTKQSKKYYCSYGHGQNNTHSSQQCYRRKKKADNVHRPSYPTQNMVRQEASRPAQRDFVAVKTKHIKKEDVDDEITGEDVLAHYSHAELTKMFDNVLARSSYTELKEIFQQVKKEMNRRGIK
ncbi:hypothetical protein KCU65_g9971, partial [Aureobasidium melanogenum]